VSFETEALGEPLADFPADIVPYGLAIFRRVLNVAALLLEGVID
jgi:hypothetical protein